MDWNPRGGWISKAMHGISDSFFPTMEEVVARGFQSSCNIGSGGAEFHLTHRVNLSRFRIYGNGHENVIDGDFGAPVYWLDERKDGRGLALYIL